MSVRTVALLAICCLPLAAQVSRPSPDGTGRPPFAAIPASVITHADSFVLAQGGQARLYNFAKGVNGAAFLPDVYKSFGLSPDGQHFLYLKARGKFPTFQLYSYDLNTATERQITDAPVHKALWSPAGSVLAYLWLDTANQFHISTHDIVSGADLELATGQLRSDFLEWAPDGQELLYMSVTALSDRAAEDGKYSQSLHRYSLRRRSEAIISSVDWAQYSENQLVVAGRDASLYRSIPNPRAERIQRFSLINGTTYAEFTDQGRASIKRWNEANSTFEAVGEGQIFLTTPHGVVVRQLKSSGIEYHYFSEAGIRPLSGNAPAGTNWKIPFHGSAAMVQGGSLYQDGSCDGVACFVTAHTGSLGYALDWQQVPQTQGGTAHVLATADGTVAITANNVTCNTGSPTCFVGWDDYNSSCPVTNYGAGNHIAVAHLDGTYSFYAHLKSGSLQIVPGQQVLQGTYLADQGHSGVAAAYNNYLSCGDHLHFSRNIGPGIWEQSIPTDFVETPCLLGCGSSYTSSNIELAPAPAINAIVPSSWTPGSAVQVTLSGQAFVFGSAVSIDAAGVTVSGVTVLGFNRIVAMLSIPAGTAPGAYNVTVTSANGSNSIPFQILAAGTGGTLTGAVATPSGTQVLSTVGTSDWAHWGLVTLASFNHKAGVVPQIGNFTVIGSAAASQYASNPIGYSWTGGAPTTSATNTLTGVSVSGQNNGFRITAPADTTTRTLRVYVGVSAAQGQFIAQLSDASASGYVDLSLSNGGVATGVYTLTYAAASAGQTLVVSFTQNSAGGSVTLQAATLSGGSTVPDFAVSTTPPTRSVAPGSSTTFTVSTSALGGFAGSVDLSVAGLPSEVTADFNPASVAAGGTSTLTLTARADTPPGSYPLSLVATSGIVTHSAPMTLAIVKADFTLSAAPATRTVIAGGSAIQTVTIAPLPGFSGTVSLSASGMPAGVTTGFSPATLAGSGVSALTLTASAGSVVGTYPITVTASSGSVTHTANFTLSVIGAAAGGSLAGSTSAASSPVQLTNEGTQDWAHWGLGGANGYNHKSGITPQLTMSLIGGTTPNGFSNNPVSFTWTNGAPTVSATTTTGIYLLGQDRGFRLTAPADTTPRTMRVYVGVYQAQGRLLAQLSDGSAPDYLDTSLINAGGTSTIVYTLTYRAASAGQTLTVTYTQNNLTIGNVTLEAATLTGPADFNIVATPPSQAAVATSSATYTVTVSSLNGFAGTVGFAVSGLPAGANAGFSPNTVSGSGSSTLTVTTAAGTAAADYLLTITATSGAVSHTANVTLTVSVPGSGGVLSGAVANSPASVQLATEGTADWAHWGLNTATDFNHKAGITSQIGNFTSVAGGAVNRFTDNPVIYSWGEGTPTVTASGVISGVYVAGQGQGFRITVPADTAVRTLRVYLGVFRTQARMVAHLSDGSAADYTDSSLINTSGLVTSAVYAFTYSAGSAGQTLTLTFTQLSTTGNVNWQAATLTAGAGACSYQLSGNGAYSSSAAGGAVTVSTGPGCPWGAVSNSSFLHITSGANGSGNGQVNISIDANATALQRTGTVTVTGQTFSIIQGANVTPPSAGLRLVPVTPCRIADTRYPAGPYGGPSLAAATPRDFNIPGSDCGIPSSARAYSLNLTVVPTAALGFLSVWPAGQAQPVVSTLNSTDGRVKANAAIVPAGLNGAITLFGSHATHVIVDVNGYFVPAAGNNDLAFYPLTPCRIADTRIGTGTFGGPALPAGVERSFPLRSSACGVPSSARAYALNMTVVPQGALGFLSAWPTGSPQPGSSTLNAPTGAVTANAAIVPAGTEGAISLIATNVTNVIIDINGYFAPPGAGGMQFYTATPCRIVDTRSPAGPFGGPAIPVSSQRDFVVAASACNIPASAGAYSLNATVVPPGALGFLSLWGAGSQPTVSTLNAGDGSVVANAALVPASATGSATAFASHLTHLILDINGYFVQ